MDIPGPVAERALRVATEVALAAPSVLHTRPWSWHVEQTTLRLRADRSRQLLVKDPDGRLLTISCGAALHHACLALAVMGRSVGVRRLPDPADPDLLASVELAGDHVTTSAERGAYAAITHRPTDRAYGTERAQSADARQLVAVAERSGAHLQLHGDEAIVVTGGDEPEDWLRAGEALSAVMLTATSLGLATAPVTSERERRSSCGYAQTGLRIRSASSSSPRQRTLS